MSNSEVELSTTWEPSTQVIESIAAAEGVDPIDLDPPLHTAIDLDALDALFSPTSGVPRPEGRVEFEYAEYEVVVSSDGSVTVDPRDTTASEQ
ncbi:MULTISPECIES: HalOD1 output domain-containing protein [Halostella]|uniref:HalOD1 output domain-containing protein n=1 Tax=Halostella TaxID=1843185 RepID=UPI00107FE677|nr:MULTISPECIES: HalOD1 output domain-containing protein [Halostella]